MKIDHGPLNTQETERKNHGIFHFFYVSVPTCSATMSAIQKSMPAGKKREGGWAMETGSKKSDDSILVYLLDQYGPFLTVSNMTEILQVSRPVIDKLIGTGDLPAAKAGKQSRIKTDEFVKWWNGWVQQTQKNILKGCLPV